MFLKPEMDDFERKTDLTDALAQTFYQIKSFSYILLFQKITFGCVR